jgi:hypothetical protein
MLTQTGKPERRIPILLYGTSYWRGVVDFDAMVRHGMIARQGVELFQGVDDPEMALLSLKARLSPDAGAETPAFAKSRTPGPDL